MKKTTAALLTALTALLLTGCASTQEARLYVLNASASLEKDAPSSATDDSPVINIATVKIPDHLSRPVIITHVANNELAFSDFHRWAGPLKSNIRQVLVENLSILLQSDRIFSDPRKQAVPADYHLEIEICQLTGTLGKTATLKAHYAIFSPDGKEALALNRFQKTIDIEGKSRRDYVTAQSQLLADFSQAIADSIPTK